MSDVTYIGHSGFAVELEQATALFDYYRGTLPDFDPAKPLYVFASHAHADHFNFDIFKLCERHPDVTYVLSHDIRRAHNARSLLRHGVPEGARIVWLRPHQREELGAIMVETLDSTDEGVAFLVECGGQTIFHAGDLNDWVWEGEPEADNRAMTEKWRAEIAKLAGRRLDLAFVVLDPRQEDDFWRGMDWFMRHTDTAKVYPMHFWKDKSVFARLRSMDCSAPYRDRIAAESEYD